MPLLGVVAQSRPEMVVKYDKTIMTKAKGNATLGISAGVVLVAMSVVSEVQI